MSENNPEHKRAARERLAAERERQKAHDKRRRTTIVGGAVICVLALAAVIGVIAANTGGDGDESSGPVVAPKGASGKDNLAVPLGKPEARSTLTVWEDFRCPACKQFEDTFRKTVHELTDSGKLKVEYHLVTLIDNNMGGSGSRRAANAAVCAQDAGKFAPYHDLLFENQPPETDDAYGSDARLTELAGKVEGLDTPAFRKCVEEGRHNSWVAKSQQAFEKSGLQGTPTVLLNGKNIYGDQSNPLTPDKLKKMVEQADKD
ncbi:thioredoxin domain-containing protein [Streptomyces sp. NA04227]|uniref:DsbA family protein n=1 Tax=Streptomyces sp. NA04227 TaxID=2742136 RepID=UPI001590A24C|nr:thioredoxin domain-containing protein [Streptomyces sp. NA04227]QKW05942.1 thioredoxin domain-containing protein [Streptomyces sp. NA04227]